MSLMRSMWYYFERDLVKWTRWKVTVFAHLVTPAAWLIFVGLTLPVTFTDNYLEYLTPGIMVMSVLFASLQSGSLVIFDKVLGFLNKFFAMDNRRVGIICSFLLSAHKKGRTTLVFCDTLKELEAIEKGLQLLDFPKADVGWYVSLSAKKYKGNEAAKKAQREKDSVKPVILTTYKMVSEGTNLPWVDTCVLGSPKADVIQIVGRIRREYPDKKLPIVFDLVDKTPIFIAYAKKRMSWYHSLGAEIVHI